MKITIRVKELTNFINRFPKEFYKVYSYNEFFKNNRIYKIYFKEYDQENIIITENIYNFYKNNEDVEDIIENYNNKDIIYVDNHGLQHINFFEMLIGLDDLEFNWNKNKFYYKYKRKKINFLNINEKTRLIEYLKNTNDPFSSTSNIFEAETSYFSNLINFS
jgi:hypothetical protein